MLHPVEVALLTGNYPGMKHFGVLNIMGPVGAAPGSVGAGIFFDTQKTCLPVFYFFAALMLATALLATLIKVIPERQSGLVREPI